jgi:general secretion pathway protein C
MQRSLVPVLVHSGPFRERHRRTRSQRLRGTSVALLAAAMHKFVSRHFGLIRFLAIGVIVSLAGSALSTHIASKLLVDVELIGASESETPEQEPGELDEEDVDERQAVANERALESMADKGTYKQRSSDEITAHNIFCPTCVPVEAEPVLASAIGSQTTGEQQSSLQLQLLATMESDDPAWSMATIRDLDNNMLGPYTANEQLRPGVTILAVERGRVIILNQGRREFIALGVTPPPAPVVKPTPAKPKSESKPGSSVAIEGAEQAINCSSEHACTDDRKIVEQLMQSPQQLMTQARMFPVTKDGETAGFRVSGVRKGSLATMLGLENGDVVSEVNGNKLASIDDALAMVQKLRRANHLSVTVERGGAVITKEISIK